MATQPNGPGLWIGGIAFAREDIAAAEQQFDPSTGLAHGLPDLQRTGQHKFAVAQQDRIGDVLEIALDGELIATPVLMEPIAGAEIMIAGSFTLEEAVSLAERLRGGCHRRAEPGASVGRLAWTGRKSVGRPPRRVSPPPPFGQIPCLPGDRIPFGSSASLIRVLKRRWAWSL